MKKYEEDWEKFLNPDIVRPSLFMATMFITTFEILRNSVIDHIRDFYTVGWSAEGTTVSKDYETNVLSRNKSSVYASLDWLKESDAIDDEDLKTFETLKKTRNVLAHQLFEAVTGQVKSDHTEQFPVLFELLKKIEVWWVVNVEISTNPDYDDVEINEKEIVPGAVLSLQMLFEVASGNTELLDAWRKGSSKRASK